MIVKVAALCVSLTSVYKSIAGVDCYDVTRNAFTFPVNCPVVAHPPCRAWSAFCRHQAKAPMLEKVLAPWCVEVLKCVGGVLEHPAFSRLWEACSIPRPGDPPVDCWGRPMWSMEVHQSWFGDIRRKRTWLLIVGIGPEQLPEIPFRLHVAKSRAEWNSLSKNKRSRTSPEMAEWLVEIARRCKR